MKTRCTNPLVNSYKNYGERGISVCARWSDPARGFEAFFADMGPRPTSKHTLERKKNDEGYSPGNCVWATRREQMANTRRSRRIVFGGETLTLSQWARRVGCSVSLLGARIGRLGWPLEKALGGLLRDRAG